MAIIDALRSFFTLPPSFRPLDGPSPIVEERALTFETIFGTGADVTDSPASRVTSENARKNPFVWACQSIISGTIANLPVDILRKQGNVRVPVEPAPKWVDEPNPFNPNYTSISYKRQLTLSLLQDGNAFVAVSPDVDEPFRLLVLNPAQVEIKDGDDAPVYVVTGADKRTTLAVLSPFNCLHIPFILPPGYTRGLNPVEAAALSIGIDLAAQKQASKFISGGGLVTGVIEVPAEAGPMTQEQMDALREGFKRRREGPNGYSIGVLQGGATFKPVSQSQAESEYIAGRRMSREEIAGMYLVPAFMIGSQEPGGVAYASAVERAQHFIDYCLIHYTGPLEVGHRRLVAGDDTYVKFNYNALLRGDLKTRAGIYDTFLQDRVMKVDEVREKEDWPPFGEANGGGFLETPNNSGIQQIPAQRAGDVNVTVPPVVTTPERAAPMFTFNQVDKEDGIRLFNETITDSLNAVTERLAAAEKRDAAYRAELEAQRTALAEERAEAEARYQHILEQSKPRAIKKTVQRDHNGRAISVLEEPV